MSELRRRRVGSQQNGTNTKANDKNVTSTLPQSNGGWSLLVIIEVVFALLVALAVGYKYALYAKELHENDMWFSNIGVGLKNVIIVNVFQ